ncbi:hypothetical protein [Pseudomonas flexibilis]|uniref:hypothetical protein n=1 Tax=Pseudomonas flexibilis TaxID=706570 RepID=UPI00068CBA0C|nr:hypothetical protein [Pseudomonas flexibilis]SCY31467.1 hypothetical protein SAMN02927929_02251 [Pseudomonas flexibilis]
MDNHNDYQEQMTDAARQFVARHRDEHLGNDQQLFERTTDYLVTSLDVPAFMAPRLAHLAMSPPPEKPVLLGWDIGTA